MNTESLLEAFVHQARIDEQSRWHDVVSDEQIAFTEELLQLEIPPLLKTIYTKISNGGIGPGPLIGLEGGYEGSWGTLLGMLEVFTSDHESNDDYQDGWLPIIDWGCAQICFVECHGNGYEISRLGDDGQYYFDDYDLAYLLERWIDGWVPHPTTGEFYKRRR